MFLGCSQACRAGAVATEGRATLGLLTLVVVGMLAVKALMVRADYAVWSVGVAAAALPSLLYVYALRLRADAGAAIIGASWILALAIFAPALFLGYPAWAAEMTGTALGALATLFILGVSARRLSAGTTTFIALLVAGALVLAVFV